MEKGEERKDEIKKIEAKKNSQKKSNGRNRKRKVHGQQCHEEVHVKSKDKRRDIGLDLRKKSKPVFMSKNG